MYKALLLTSAVYFIISIRCIPSHKIGKRWVNPDNLTNEIFSFDCTDRPIGFYADIDYNCQIFHMCDQQGHRIPHSCANETSFNQEYRICDWESNFVCDEAPKWYFLNGLTYATDPPLLDEKEEGEGQD